MESRKKRELLTLGVVFVLVLALSAIAVYLIADKRTGNEAVRTSMPPTASPINGTTPDPGSTTPTNNNESFLDELFGVPPNEAHSVGAGTGAEAVARITIRLLLAALLGAALAFRPRKRLTFMKRNPYVAQTQILLAIVAAALMIVVGNNAARAFGIFAAVSVVRFRTNIRDPKEITVLLISLTVGLASGVGRWDLALILAIFSLLVLWILEYREATEVTRAMNLKVVTRDVVATQAILRDILKQHGFDSELRGIERQNSDESVGSLVYSVDLSPTVTTDDISKEILARDSTNVGSMEWEQKKSFSYIYQ